MNAQATINKIKNALLHAGDLRQFTGTYGQFVKHALRDAQLELETFNPENSTEYSIQWAVQC